MSPFKGTRMLPLDQNIIPDHLFSICVATEMAEATKPNGSESPNNNTPEHIT
jgi:hypothetical protein